MLNYHSNYYQFRSFMFLLSLFFLVLVGSHNLLAQSDISELTIKLKPEKTSYILGELVVLRVEVLNETDSPINFPKCALDPFSDSLKVFISHLNGEFLEYQAPRNAKKDKWCGDYELKPGSKFDAQTSVLWNLKMQSAHLNESAAKQVTDGKILTDLAMPAVGKYSIKANFGYLGNNLFTRESATVEIELTEPKYGDLEVWQRIKNNADFAYFIQTGKFHYSIKTQAQRNKFIQSVKQTLSDNPNSLYSILLRESLDNIKH